jgi:copper chaperone CopZ
MSQTLNYQVVGAARRLRNGSSPRIGNALRRVRGVQAVDASARTQQVQVTIDPAQVGPEQVKCRLEQIGYQVKPEDVSQK